MVTWWRMQKRIQPFILLICWRILRNIALILLLIQSQLLWRFYFIHYVSKCSKKSTIETAVWYEWYIWLWWRFYHQFGQGRAKSRSWCPPNTDREIFEISVGGGSRIKYANRRRRRKVRFSKAEMPWKTMKTGQKYVVLIVFTVLCQNTYGKSRSVGSFSGRPTDRAQNMVFGGQRGREFGRPSQPLGVLNRGMPLHIPPKPVKPL